MLLYVAGTLGFVGSPGETVPLVKIYRLSKGVPTFVREFSPEPSFRVPNAIAVDSQGYVFLANNGQVSVYDPFASGAVSALATIAMSQSVWDLAFDRYDNLYVIHDNLQGAISVFSPDQSVPYANLSAGPTSQITNVPYFDLGLTINTNRANERDELYIATAEGESMPANPTSSIDVYTLPSNGPPSGPLWKASASLAGPSGGPFTPQKIALDANQTLFVANLSTVLIMFKSPSWAPNLFAPIVVSGFEKTLSIAVDDEQYVYVTDLDENDASGRVACFTPTNLNNVVDAGVTGINPIGGLVVANEPPPPPPPPPTRSWHVKIYDAIATLVSGIEDGDATRGPGGGIIPHGPTPGPTLDILVGLGAYAIALESRSREGKNLQQAALRMIASAATKAIE